MGSFGRMSILSTDLESSDQDAYFENNFEQPSALYNTFFFKKKGQFLVKFSVFCNYFPQNSKHTADIYTKYVLRVHAYMV